MRFPSQHEEVYMSVYMVLMTIKVTGGDNVVIDFQSKFGLNCFTAY